MARVETSFHVVGNAHPADPPVEDLTDGGVPGILSARNWLAFQLGENVSGKSALHCSEEGDARNETDGRTVRSDRSIDRFEIEARNDLLSLCSDRRIACKQRSRGGRARSRVQTIIATLFTESINHLCLIANRSCFCLADSADSNEKEEIIAS